ncbi:MAG TPA: hypothetical protein VG297_19480 [Bryobacteraceae bacterium]|jgi:hypothetical protein|nr:hypothetical protein [Bryobacteraceae bacterium]
MKYSATGRGSNFGPSMVAAPATPSPDTLLVLIGGLVTPETSPPFRPSLPKINRQ